MEALEKAKQHLRDKQYDEAEALLTEILQQQETPAACRNLALVKRARGETQQAMKCLDRALALDARDHAAMALMAELYFDLGDARQAIGHLVLAVLENPGSFDYKQRFITLAGGIPFNRPNEMMEKALLECLKTPELDCTHAQILWYTLLTAGDGFRDLYKSSNSGSYPAFNTKAFDKCGDLSPLLAPFFLQGLKRLAVYHPVFEQFLTHLRLTLLRDLSVEKKKFAPADFISLAHSLAAYCDYTEFVFATTAEEDAFVARARADKNMGAAETALLACYVLVKSAESEALAKIRQTIPALTEISAGVSSSVRGQYEEFPYPRWKALPPLSPDEAEARFVGAKAKMLVAGCGTGREAVALSKLFPDAEILAVDLSLSSLAYAVKQAEACGAKNITFRQADILKLGAFGEKFDYINSSGVLHHLENPLQGWEVLRGLLKDDGLMRVALYSKTARRHLTVAQRVAVEKGFSSDAEGMKKFRAAMPQILDRATVADIMNRPDYFHLSMFRDLLFHVQEHCFDIPQISAALEKLKMEFVKFLLPVQVEELYRRKFPADRAQKDLSNWHRFEQENPDTFSAMYHFWCKKA